ncbi:hypothetical protein OAS39_04135 [Pirellulales bacterium]|nr:hypothetical protein [Pirellulales bacterium]
MATGYWRQGRRDRSHCFRTPTALFEGCFSRVAQTGCDSGGGGLSIRVWMRWLSKNDHITHDPAADVCYIQEMLGHENLETTQVYTRVSIRKLQEVHARTHPVQASRKAKFDSL